MFLRSPSNKFCLILGNVGAGAAQPDENVVQNNPDDEDEEEEEEDDEVSHFEIFDITHLCLMVYCVLKVLHLGIVHNCIFYSKIARFYDFVIFKRIDPFLKR